MKRFVKEYKEMIVGWGGGGDKRGKEEKENRKLRECQVPEDGVKFVGWFESESEIGACEVKGKTLIIRINVD